MQNADGIGGRSLGPLLYFRGIGGGHVSLVAVVVRPEGTAPPVISVEGEEAPSRPIFRAAGIEAHGYALNLPAEADARYVCDGEEIPVACDFSGDLRIAFTSCNGQETGDLDREAAERNEMWRRLCGRHRAAPFQLMLQGGDQIYADEVTKAHPLSEGWPEHVPEVTAAEQALELHAALLAGFVDRYMTTFGQPEYAWLAARVPTLAMWDDHDICDGWGSLAEDVLRSRVGRTLFDAARQAFMVFQMGAPPGIPAANMLDPEGRSLSWSVDLPGVRIVAPDLRSERTRHRVMGEAGWRALERALEAAPERLLLLSSVPALGPRLSIVEWIMQQTPRAEEYEDDLRDQWQSRAHREEWREFLRRLVVLQQGPTAVTVVSGEIHLATRATMATRGGPIHQLVASGISHPAPTRVYAWGLDALARLGEAPLKSHPIRMRTRPGRRTIYSAERNFLVLDRRDGRWTAEWELEDFGTTAPLEI